MYLEVTKEQDDGDPWLEIFYSDQTHTMTVNLFKPDIPLDIVEWAISEAKKQLPPSKNN